MQRQNNTPYALLGLLSLEPMSGYDIRREFQETMTYIWNESYGQIYPTLKRLRSHGLIAPVRKGEKGARGRRAYAITRKGRALLRGWLALPPNSTPVRDEFLLKLFLSRFAPTGTRGDHLRRFRAEQRNKQAQLEAIRRIILAERRRHPDLKLWLIMLSHGVKICRAEISWCDKALRDFGRTSRKRKNLGDGLRNQRR
jgi:DNA-binding PadR family transcriptional regulator